MASLRYPNHLNCRTHDLVIEDRRANVANWHRGALGDTKRKVRCGVGLNLMMIPKRLRTVSREALTSKGNIGIKIRFT
jgi:hypothetical protein